jgi:RNA polymerase sigma factor (sigma-70 family)
MLVSNRGIERIVVTDCQQRLLRVLDQDGPGLLALLTRLTLRPDVAEDLMQDLFLNLGRAEGFLRCQNPSAYARRAAMHLAFNWRRNRKRRREEAYQPQEPSALEPGPLMRLVQTEQTQQVLDALAELPEASRDLVVERFIEGESYGQIARRLGRTDHQARALCHKALGRLRRVMAEEARHVRP